MSATAEAPQVLYPLTIAVRGGHECAHGAFTAFELRDNVETPPQWGTGELECSACHKPTKQYYFCPSGLCESGTGVCADGCARLTPAELAAAPAQRAAKVVFDAASAGDADAVAAALAAGGAPDGFKGPCKETALLVAAKAGNAAVVRALLAAGADVRARAVTGWEWENKDALYAAVDEDKPEVVAALLAAGAPVTGTNLKASPLTILQFAVQQGRAACAKLLLDAGATATETGRDERTPSALPLALVFALGARPCNAELVKMLLATGAVAAGPCALWVDPFEGVCGTKPGGFHSYLGEACSLGDAAAAAALLAGGAPVGDVNSGNYGSSRTPLSLAVESGSFETVDVLLRAGADASAALALMVEGDQGGLVLELVRAGKAERAWTSPVKGQEGWTLLHWAARKGLAELAKELIRLGWDRNAMDALGLPPGTPVTWTPEAEIAAILAGVSMDGYYAARDAAAASAAAAAEAAAAAAAAAYAASQEGRIETILVKMWEEVSSGAAPSEDLAAAYAAVIDAGLPVDLRTILGDANGNARMDFPTPKVPQALRDRADNAGMQLPDVLPVTTQLMLMAYLGEGSAPLEVLKVHCARNVGGACGNPTSLMPGANARTVPLGGNNQMTDLTLLGPLMARKGWSGQPSEPPRGPVADMAKVMVEKLMDRSDYETAVAADANALMAALVPLDLSASPPHRKLRLALIKLLADAGMPAADPAADAAAEAARAAAEAAEARAALYKAATSPPSVEDSLEEAVESAESGDVAPLLAVLARPDMNAAAANKTGSVKLFGNPVPGDVPLLARLHWLHVTSGNDALLPAIDAALARGADVNFKYNFQGVMPEATPFGVMFYSLGALQMYIPMRLFNGTIAKGVEAMLKSQGAAAAAALANARLAPAPALGAQPIGAASAAGEKPLVICALVALSVAGEGDTPVRVRAELAALGRALRTAGATLDGAVETDAAVPVMSEAGEQQTAVFKGKTAAEVAPRWFLDAIGA